MHKKALECAKKVLEEFCMIPEPTCEQAQLFETVMCGYAKFIESEYKADIIDKMKEADEEEKIMSKMDNRMGYRNRDSMGRFTSGRRGYRPYLGMDDEQYMEEYMDNPAMFKENMGYGYNGSYGVNSSGSQTGMNDTRRMGYEHTSKYGKPYEEYRNYRRNYTETHDPDQKKMMSSKMSEIFNDMEDMANDMVHDMDANEKEKYRQKLTALAQKLQ